MVQHKVYQIPPGLHILQKLYHWELGNLHAIFTAYDEQIFAVSLFEEFMRMCPVVVQRT